MPTKSTDTGSPDKRHSAPVDDPDAEFYEDDDSVEVVLGDVQRWGFEVIFGDDELARLGPMHRSTGQGTFSAFVHDLAMQAVADWEAKQAAEPAAVTAAD